ncbi:glycosyltransferase [Fluviispira multicolorata]|uniref:Glycosyltransferase n=1 Tax=Fluviispira multicolorata TaxID=2654512 RepID=A0A833JEW1_9BACT|nr:glycosyltransferase [Fluviispira multicolorata]KAB8030639.1 glycosyltransferase [Fluviispira multicolorata]
MKNILFFNQTIDFGGHEIMSLEIIKEFSLNNSVNVIICIHKMNEKFYNELLKINNIKIIFHKINYSKFDFIRGFFYFFFSNSLKKILISENIDTVIAIQGSIKMSAIIHFVTRRFNINSFSYIPFHFKSIKRNIINKLVIKFLFKLPKNYLVLSDYWKKELLLITKRKKEDFYIIKNFFPENEMQIEKRGNTSDNKKNIYLIGRICEQKNQIFLCDAIKSFPNLSEIYNFYIVGNRVDYDIISNHISVKSGKIKILPWSSLNTIYSNADIILMTSHYEGVPLVVIEAMALKKPLVLPGIKELKDFTLPELIYEPENLSSLNFVLTENVSKFSDEVIQRNYNYYINNFSKESFKNDCREFLNNVLKITK